MPGVQSKWPPPPKSFIPSPTNITSSVSPLQKTGLSPRVPKTTADTIPKDASYLVEDFLSGSTEKPSLNVPEELPVVGHNDNKEEGDPPTEAEATLPVEIHDENTAKPAMGAFHSSAGQLLEARPPTSTSSDHSRSGHLVGKDRFWSIMKSLTTPTIYTSSACGLIFGLLLALFTLGLFAPPTKDNAGVLNPTPQNPGSLRGCCSSQVRYNYTADVLRGWSYVPMNLWDPDFGGHLGPESWGSLIKKDGSLMYPHCSTQNLYQSPIALMDNRALHEGTIKLERTYGHSKSALQLVPRNQAVYPGWEVNVWDTDSRTENTWQIDGTEYTLSQLHFHSPSEHTINGEVFDLEGHFVHQNSVTRDYAVFGIVFRLDSEQELPNPFLDYFWSHQFTHNSFSIPLDFNLTAFISDVEPSMYRYTGTTTVPPCRPGTLWYVAVSNMKVNSAQLADFRQRMQLLPSTARSIQPQNGRDVFKFQIRV